MVKLRSAPAAISLEGVGLLPSGRLIRKHFRPFCSCARPKKGLRLSLKLAYWVATPIWVTRLIEPVERRRIVDQDAIADRFVRRPIGQEVEQGGVVGLGIRLFGRVGPVAAPDQ